MSIASGARTVFQNANLLDGDNPARKANVVISGDRIESVGSAPVVDVITRRRHAGGELRLADLLDHYPVALLAEEGGTA